MILFQEKQNGTEISVCNGYDITGCENHSIMNSFILGLHRTLHFILHVVTDGKFLSPSQMIPRRDRCLHQMLMSLPFAHPNLILMSLLSVNAMPSSEPRGL